MKKIIYLIMFGIFLATPSIVKADSYYKCDATDLTKLQKLATNIISSYDYIETFDANNVYGNVSFTVKLTNLNPKLYVVNKETRTRYNYTSNELVVSNLSPGQTLHYEIYANDYGCNGKYLMMIYVNIPQYNKYYVDDLCKNYQSYKLCNKWSKVDMPYDEFKIAVSKYSENKKNDKIEEDNKDKTFQEIFIEVVAYLDKYKMPIFGSIIITSGTLIILLKIFKRKERLILK